MEGTIGIFDVEVAGVDTRVVGWRVALSGIGSTGGMPILSPEGAAATEESSNTDNSNRFMMMIIYLLSFWNKLKNIKKEVINY